MCFANGYRAEICDSKPNLANEIKDNPKNTEIEENDTAIYTDLGDLKISENTKIPINDRQAGDFQMTINGGKISTLWDT